MKPLEARPFAVASLLASLLVVACGGATSSSGESVGKATPGGPCATPGASMPAADGCNGCTCSSKGTWACTEKACLPASDGGIAPSSCTPGATRPAGDACNTCTCSSQGTWQCTRSVCNVCTNYASKPAPDGCNTCTCLNFGWVCTTRACPVAYDGGPAPVCVEGESRPTSDCNTCICHAGGWQCSTHVCAPIDSGLPPACTDGDTKKVDCNTCICRQGSWSCNLAGCNGCGGFSGAPCIDAGPPKGCGGWLGNTCTASEYCAYEIGQMCGAADASATCKPRPTVCDTVYAPVCGCDGKTYDNDCTAAAAGTGVNASGACPP